MDQVFVIEFPASVEADFLTRGADLIELLNRQHGWNLREGTQEAVKRGPSGGKKEVALIIIASGITAHLLASGIAKIIDAWGRNRVVRVEKTALSPVLDGEGKQVFTSDGAVLLQLTTDTEIIQPNPRSPPPGSTSLAYGDALRFETTSGTSD